MPSSKRLVAGGRAPRLNFPVTEEMIALAIPEDSGHCMIADSLKAAVPHATMVTVDLASIRYTDGRTGRRLIYFTPASAQVALVQFDQGILPEPFFVREQAAQIIEPREPRPKRLPEPATELTLPELETTPEAGLGMTLPEQSAAAMEVDEMTLPGRSEPLSPSLSETVESQQLEPRSYRKAQLIPNPNSGSLGPIKLNGSPPPFGPLAWGAGTGNLPAGYRTGRRRKFGLKALGTYDASGRRVRDDMAEAIPSPSLPEAPDVDD